VTRGPLHGTDAFCAVRLPGAGALAAVKLVSRQEATKTGPLPTPTAEVFGAVKGTWYCALKGPGMLPVRFVSGMSAAETPSSCSPSRWRRMSRRSRVFCDGEVGLSWELNIRMHGNLLICVAAAERADTPVSLYGGERRVVRVVGRVDQAAGNFRDGTSEKHSEGVIIDWSRRR
jgi:hypothetical protein